MAVRRGSMEVTGWVVLTGLVLVLRARGVMTVRVTVRVVKVVAVVPMAFGRMAAEYGAGSGG
jgi:hypothetical protein